MRELARRVERLTTAVREFEMLSLAVAHDFRKPLRLIEGALRPFAAPGQPLDENSRRAIQAALAEVMQVEAMIASLSELYWTSSRPLELISLDMESLVRDAWASMTPRSDTVLRLGKLPRALGDRDMLQLVWKHLLANAIACCRGRVNAFIEITGGGSTDKPVYGIRDNGIGLALRYSGKLTHGFEQIERQSPRPGAGVALAIVQRLVTRHRGTVWIETELDAGAHVQFSLGEVMPEDVALPP